MYKNTVRHRKLETWILFTYSTHSLIEMLHYPILRFASLRLRLVVNRYATLIGEFNSCLQFKEWNRDSWIMDWAKVRSGSGKIKQHLLQKL